MEPTELLFKTYHVRYDPEVHDAAWGARLIFADVRDGYHQGVVYDRQSAIGDRETIEGELFPLFDRFIRVMRWAMNNYMVESDSRDRWVLRKDLSLIVGSPQASCGYLYVSALHERPNKKYSTWMEALKDEHKEHAVWLAVEDMFIALDERERAYRDNKWTGIRDIQRRRKELQEAWA